MVPLLYHKTLKILYFKKPNFIIIGQLLMEALCLSKKSQEIILTNLINKYNFAGFQGGSIYLK